MISNIHRVVKKGCKIVAVEPLEGIIHAKLAAGQAVPVNVYSYTPCFRWPMVGEEWILREENGSWFLHEIMEQQRPTNPKSGEMESIFRLGTHTPRALDSLYGVGASSEFAKRTVLSADEFAGTTPTITELPGPNSDTVLAQVIWSTPREKVATLHLEFHPEFVHYAKLSVESAFREKKFIQAIFPISDWLREIGIKGMTAVPANPHAEYVLARSGFHWQPFGGRHRFSVRFDQFDRRDEYRQWIEADSPVLSEPEWRKQLQEA